MNLNSVKVSVIIPTYKRSSDIGRAVESVLNQTLDAFEVIVVDDNGVSTDEGKATALVMKKYMSDSRLKYIRHETNKNGSAARNTGIKASRGKYVAFLDDDDAYYPERLEKMYYNMEQLDSTWGACYTAYVKHQPSGRDQFSAEKVEGYIYKQTLMRSFFLGSGSNLFFRKSAIDEIGLFDESFKRNQDLEYLVRITRKYKMAYVDDVLLECFYDIRTNKVSLEASIEREKAFRDKFSPFLTDFTDIEKREINIMWDIDWVRDMIDIKKYLLAIKELVCRNIPIRVLIKYAFYVIDRKKNNTCYGFVVKL